MSIIKKYKMTLIFAFILSFIYLYNQNLGEKAFSLTLSNIKTMLSFVPAIYILIGLMDVWVPKDKMIKFMGEKSGIYGIAIALLLGSIAAGPLYAAFPIAAILLKKGARLAYVLFFLGVWTSSKLPIMLYEIASFGSKFTFYHVASSLIIYLLGSIAIEKLLPQNTIDDIYLKCQTM